MERCNFDQSKTIDYKNTEKSIINVEFFKMIYATHLVEPS